MRTRSFDLFGAMTITMAAVLLVYALVEAPETGWTGVRTIGLFVASAVLLVLFVRIEARSPAPLVPLRIFRSRMLVGGNLGMTMLGTIGFGISLVVSLYAQQVLGYSAIRFGLASVVMTVTAVAGSYAGQALAGRLGVRTVAVTGLVLGVISSLLLTGVSVGGTYFGDIFFGLLVFGPGLGCCYVATSIAALSGVAEGESGLGSAINTAAFQFGGALGVALTSTVAVSTAGAAGGVTAINEGLRAGFFVCVILAAIGALITFVLLARPADHG